MRKFAFAALAAGVVFASSPAFAQVGNITFCKDQLASVLGRLGMQVADMQDVEQMKVGKSQPSIVTMGRPKSCTAGELRITMWHTCTLQAIATTGGCEVKGVSPAGFLENL